MNPLRLSTDEISLRQTDSLFLFSYAPHIILLSLHSRGLNSLQLSNVPKPVILGNFRVCTSLRGRRKWGRVGSEKTREKWRGALPRSPAIFLSPFPSTFTPATQAKLKVYIGKIFCYVIYSDSMRRGFQICVIRCGAWAF